MACDVRMVAAVKGHRTLVVMPSGMSPERLATSRAFGAEVLIVGDFHVAEALAKTRELGTQPGYFAPQQLDSGWNENVVTFFCDEARKYISDHFGRSPSLSGEEDRAGPGPCVRDSCGSSGS